MKSALFTGSFDPITLGHIDVIERAISIFDSITVLVANNPVKKSAFSPEERLDFINRCIKQKGFINVNAAVHNGLVADYAKKHGINVIIRGIRSYSDFEYEMAMSSGNRKLCGGIETVFIPVQEKYMYVSSSLVREIAKYGGDILPYVSAEIAEDVLKRLTERL